MRVLIDQPTLQQRIGELASQIVAVESEPPVVIGILNGAVPFMMALIDAFPADYARRLDWDFIDASSYAGTQSSGRVVVGRPPVVDLQGRRVLLVDGIIDSGRTVRAILDHFDDVTGSVKVATLLNKPSRRVVDVPVDHAGFVIDDHFVVGFGMDYNQRHRSLRHIAVIEDGEEDT